MKIFQQKIQKYAFLHNPGSVYDTYHMEAEFSAGLK